MIHKNAIYDLIKDIDNPIGAEIGVMKGVVSLFLLENKEDLILYSIDPYLVYEQYYDDNKGARQHNLSQKQFDEIYEDVERKLKEFGDRSIFLRMSSTEAAKTIEDHSLEFVFIDANHLYEYVKEDILTWLPKIKEGGIISGHDYNLTNEQKNHVCKAVDESFDKDEIKVGPADMWWVIV